MPLEAGSRYRRPLGFILVLGAVLGLFVLRPQAFLTGEISDKKPIFTLCIIVVLYLLRPLVLGPLSVITLFIGFRFGIILGVPIAIAGTFVTTLPPYVLTRYSNTEQGWIRKLSETGSQFVDVSGELRSVIGARVSPAPADPVSYGLGLAKVTPSNYVLGTIIGELPWTLAYIILGASLNRFKLDSITLEPRFALLTIMVSFFLLGPPLYRSLKSNGWLTYHHE